MICITPATHTVAGGVLAMTGTEYYADKCNMNSYVFLSANEYELLQPSEFALTASQGSQIAIAIALCWAIGAVFRIIFYQLKSNESVQND